MDDVRLALELELTRQFIIYQWRIDNPWPQPDETFEDMRLKYSNDVLFHAKVKTMVGGVMAILNKHIK